MKTFVIISVFSLFVTNVVFGQCSNPNCGSDFAICGNTAQLNVQNATTGYWTAYDGSQVMTPAPVYSPSSSSANANVAIPRNFIGNEIIAFVWTDNSGPCTDTVVVEFVEVPVVNAGSDKDVCGNCTQLEAVGAGFGGSWLPNGCDFEDWSDENTEVCSAAYGARTFTWLETNSSVTSSLSCSDIDEMVVTFWREPTANILTDAADSVACGLTFDNLRAENPGSGVSGYWWNENPAVLFTQLDLSTSVTVPSYGYHDFYWIEETGPGYMPVGWCNDTAGPLTIHFLNEQPIHAGFDRDVFGYECQLEGASLSELNPYTDCTYFWSSEDVFFDDLNDLQTSISVSEYGMYELVLHSSYVNMSGCTASDTVNINFRDPIYIGVDETEKYDFEIFPNPAKDYIRLSQNENYSLVQIFDINGKLVKTFESGFDKIDVSGFEQGLYIVVVNANDFVLTGKFVR
jgi:hypothetical protein